MDVAVLHEDTSSWGRGEDTILRYSLERDDHRIRIESRLGYLTSFNASVPIRPLSYITPTWCAFQWDFPILDFKVLNNRQDTLFLTEVVFDVDESRPDLSPFFTIQRDVQQAFAGSLLLVNEGWCDITDLTISFRIVPGELAEPMPIEPPYPHSMNLPLLEESAQVDVLQAFQEDGVDLDGLIRLYEGNWESQKVFIAAAADGSEERIPAAELEQRFKKCLGPFQTAVGTLLGEISFPSPHMPGSRQQVKFFAHVYLENKNRRGLPKPPSCAYQTTFDVENKSYQRRVSISHELQLGEADRFTVKVAVPRSSFHRFRVTIRDITGLTIESLPIEMQCFVPRRRRQWVENALAPQQTA